MSLTLKSPREIAVMREAGRIVADTLQEMQARVEPDMTTRDLDQIAERFILQRNAEPAFPHINNFPGTACISVNEEVVHGIPGKRILRTGDIVKIDVGAIYQGYHGDAAITVAVGSIPEEARRLMEVTEGALAEGIKAAQPGGFLHDIGAAIQDWVEPSGFSVVRQYVGHGVGRHLHEDPSVPHYRQPNRGPRLRPGMTLTIEPMINAGTFDTVILPDRWTVVTKDGRLSAQFEHSVVITEDGPEVLTIPSNGQAWSIPFLQANRVQ